MIEQLSLFELKEVSIKNKLSKFGINNKVLSQYPTIYFYINRLNTKDYFFTVNEFKDIKGYMMDELPLALYGTKLDIEDIVHYILNDLKQAYYITNSKVEYINLLESTNNNLTKQLAELQTKLLSIQNLISI
jgi:hypothetical protein